MKTNIFKTLAIFLALGVLSACNVTSKNNDNEGEEPAASEVQPGTSKKHTHKFVQDPDKQNIEATCSKEGVKYEKCECGETRETKIAKKDHTYGDGIASGNCGEAGKITYTCTACGATKEEVTGYIQHDWEVKGSVAAGDGGLAYDLLKCKKCQKDGLLVKVRNDDGTDNMTITGTPKEAPTGCVKLGAANDYIMGAIKLDAAKTGKLFFRGSMDYWYTSSNQNEQKGIYDGKGTASKDNGIALEKLE